MAKKVYKKAYVRCWWCRKRIVKRFKNGERPNFCYGSRHYECLACCEAHGWG